MAFLYARTPFSLRAAASYSVSRFARIAPVYLFVILAAWYIRGVLDPNFIYDINNHNIVRHLLFSGSQSVFWSIPPEVQFYVFFLGLWWAFYKASLGNYYPSLAMGCLSLSMLWLAPGLPGTTLPTKLPFFLFGSVAGVVSAQAREQCASGRLVFGFQVVALCAAAVFLHAITGGSAEPEAPFDSLPYSVICALVVFAFSLPSKYADNLFGSRALVLLGKWSFAIYLLHDPCIYVARKVVLAGGLPNGLGLCLALALTLTGSALLHKYLERPVQRRLKALFRLSQKG